MNFITVNLTNRILIVGIKFKNIFIKLNRLFFGKKKLKK